MKHNNCKISERTGAKIPQQERNTQVIKTAKPTESIRNPRIIEQKTNDRHFVTGRKPDFQRQGMHEPVAVEFGQTSIKIQNGHHEFECVNVPLRNIFG